jgi:CDGSH-type Zn-finger protein
MKPIKREIVMKATGPSPKPDVPMKTFWLCKCGYYTAVHRVFCDHCGKHKNETTTVV